MRSFSRIGFSGALVLIAGLLGACSNSNNNVAPTSVRLVNAVSTSTGTTSPILDLSLSGTPAVAGVTVGTASGYASENPSTYAASVTDETSTLSAGTPLTVNLGTAESYSIVAYTLGTTVAMGYLTDNLGIPSAGQSTVAFANFSTDAGPLDVYVLPAGTTAVPNGSLAVFPGVTGQSLPVIETAGTYTIIATAPNNPSDIRFVNGAVNLAGGQAEVVAFTPTTGGGLVNGMLIVQGGNAATMAMNYARVRIAAELPTANTQVGAVVGTTPVTASNAPYVGPYTLVPAGGAVTGVTAGTTAVAPPPTTLAAGGDYSLVVYGSTPVAALFPDDNHYPGNGSASIRIVNAAPGSGAVNLYLSSAFTAAATYATIPVASPYTGITPATAEPIALYGASGSSIPLPGTSATFVAGSVYTAFVYTASNNSPAAFLVKDR